MLRIAWFTSMLRSHSPLPPFPVTGPCVSSTSRLVIPTRTDFCPCDFVAAGPLSSLYGPRAGSRSELLVVLAARSSLHRVHGVWTCACGSCTGMAGSRLDMTRAACTQTLQRAQMGLGEDGDSHDRAASTALWRTYISNIGYTPAVERESVSSSSPWFPWWECFEHCDRIPASYENTYRRPESRAVGSPSRALLQTCTTTGMAEHPRSSPGGVFALLSARRGLPGQAAPALVSARFDEIGAQKAPACVAKIAWLRGGLRWNTRVFRGRRSVWGTDWTPVTAITLARASRSARLFDKKVSH
jgi:hypothetical protein